MLKISVISRVCSTSEITEILNTFDETFLVFAPKKVNILFIFSVEGENLTFSLVIYR